MSDNTANPRASIPRERIKIVLLEGVSETAVETFAQYGYRDVTLLPGSPSGDELGQLLAGAHIDTVIIQIARRAGGQVSAAQVAADTPLSFAECAQALDALCAAGACHLHVSDKGVKMYHFPEFGEGGAGGTFV